MKYLKKFESFDNNYSDTADPVYHKNHYLGNKIVDLLSEKDIYPVRKPDSWEEVENDAIDFEDLPSEALKMIFELPLYKVNGIDDLTQIFNLAKPDFVSDAEWLIQAKQDVESGNIQNTNFIFYESLNVKHQYFLVQFKINQVDCGLFVDTQGFNYMRYVLMIKSFSDLYDYYKKEVELSEHYNYVDSLIQLNEGLVDVEKIKQIWSKISDRVKGLSDSMKRKIVIYGIASMMAMAPIYKVKEIIQNYQTEDIIVKDAIDEALSQFKDATELRVSEEGRKHIKEHEGLKLTAYKLGDGKITIGYGHAEPVGKSKYKKGQKISKDEADRLFTKDLTETADGVRRIFKQWKEKGIDRKITQDQFDALVSMAFNMGISGLRQTDLIQQIKSGNLEKAGELIKTTKINDDTFPGLRDRREKEAEMFMSYLNENQPDKG